MKGLSEEERAIRTTATAGSRPGPRASEAAMQIALDAVRIHGGDGYPTELDVERYVRDAPLLIVGAGTNQIRRNVFARQLERATMAP